MHELAVLSFSLKQHNFPIDHVTSRPAKAPRRDPTMDNEHVARVVVNFLDHPGLRILFLTT